MLLITTSTDDVLFSGTNIDDFKKTLNPKIGVLMIYF